MLVVLLFGYWLQEVEIKYKVERKVIGLWFKKSQESKIFSNNALILNINIPLQLAIRREIHSVIGKFSIYWT